MGITAGIRNNKMLLLMLILIMPFVLIKTIIAIT